MKLCCIWSSQQLVHRVRLLLRAWHFIYWFSRILSRVLGYKFAMAIDDNCAGPAVGPRPPVFFCEEPVPVPMKPVLPLHQTFLGPVLSTTSHFPIRNEILIWAAPLITQYHPTERPSCPTPPGKLGRSSCERTQLHHLMLGFASKFLSGLIGIVK